jgi:hypothetical protein
LLCSAWCRSPRTLLVFLGGPLYFVISGALSDPDGRPTLANVAAALTEPQYQRGVRSAAS